MSVWCTPTRLATSLSVTPYRPCLENSSSATSRICSIISARCSALVGRLPRAFASLPLSGRTGADRLRLDFTSAGTSFLIRRAPLLAESHGHGGVDVQGRGVEHGKVGPVRLRHQQEYFRAAQDQALRSARL